MKNSRGLTLLQALLLSLLLVCPVSPAIMALNATSGDWPMGSRDPSRSNFAETESLLSPPLMLKWSHKLNYTVDAITVAAGRIFAGVGGAPNLVVCFDVTDGREIWTYEVQGSTSANDIPPTYVNGEIYAGGQYAKRFDVLNATDGAFIWGMNLASCIFAAPPIAAGGLVYLRTRFNALYAIDPVTRSVRWNLTGVRSFAAPAVSDGLLFVPLSTVASGPVLMALDSSTGTLRWNKSVLTQSLDVPLVSGGNVFIAGGESGGYSILALSTSDGSQVWKTAVDSGFQPAWSGTGFMAEGHGVLYVSVADANMTTSRILAMNSSSGALLWRFERSGGASNTCLFMTPTLANGVLYVVDYFGGKIYSLSAQSGMLLWEYSGGWRATQAVVVNGVLYVFLGDELMAFANAAFNITVSSRGAITVDGLTHQPSELPKTFQWSSASNHTLSIPQQTIGFLIQSVFDHWVVNGSPVSGATITVTIEGPTEVEVVWRDDYTQLILAGGGGIVLAAVIIVLAKRKTHSPKS